MKYIAKAIVWCVDHMMEIMVLSFPLLVVWFLFELKHALECAMW